MKRFYSVCLLLVALVMLFWIFGRESDSRATMREASQTPPPVVVPVAEKQSVATETASRVAVGSADPVLVVRDQAGSPVAGAQLREYAHSEVGTLRPEVSSLSTSDTAGEITSAQLRDPQSRFLVTHPDFVPAVVAGGIKDRADLTLTKSARLEVTVITEFGAPLSGAQLMMSPNIEPTPDGAPPVADGAPLHGRPIWTRVTDMHGRAEFRSAPAGQYYVGAFHEHYAPLSFEAKFLRVDGDTRVTITMQDMYGVAFALPSPGAVSELGWSWQHASVDHSFGVVSRTAYCRQGLQARFPDAHVFVHRPSPRMLEIGESLKVGLRVVLVDGTAWQGTWPLTPLRELTDPVFLEQDTETRYRRVKIEVVTPSGRVLDTPFRVFRKGPAGGTGDKGVQSGVDSVVHGEAYFLAHGTYGVLPRPITSQTYFEFNEMSFDVSEAQPPTDVVRLSVKQEYVPVVIEPKCPTDAVLSPIHFAINDERKQGPMIANWTPSRGPIRVLVRAGPLTITSHSQCYETAEVQVIVPVDEPMAPVGFPLTERPPATISK